MKREGQPRLQRTRHRWNSGEVSSAFLYEAIRVEKDGQLGSDTLYLPPRSVRGGDDGMESRSSIASVKKQGGLVAAKGLRC